MNDIPISDEGTDTEAGQEGLDPAQDEQQELKALEVMRTRGLISEEVYRARLEKIRAEKR